MKRLRWTLLGVALALAAPVLLLVSRALDGAAVEREVGHRAVAERAFDEMERALSHFLEKEEARPVEAYRFGSDTREGGSSSPLSVPAAERFVVGHFQIEADGRITTPLLPEDVDAARLRGDWPPAGTDGERILRAAAHLEQVVYPYWREVRERGRGVTGRAPEAEGVLPERLRTARKEEAAAGSAPSGTYEILQSFNRGAQQRESRKRVVTLARPPAAGPPRPGALDERTVDAAVASEAPAPSSPRAEGDAFVQPAERVRIVREPMRGVVLDAAHLMLYRTVLVDRQGLRQGLLLDRAELGSWLQAEVITTSPLAGSVQLAFLDDSGTAPPAPAGWYVVSHGFAPPFDALRAELAVEPLPGLDRSRDIQILAGLLLGVTVAGLLAIYRMSAVVVHFAERRSNFVAAVTHELKTPLTAIRMYADMLRDGMATSEEKRDEYYRTIGSESERLSRLIDNVLEFSRLEKGGRELTWVVGGLEDVLDEVAGKLRPHLQHAGFELVVELESGLPPVRYDRDAVVQMLFNLVDNALKYARDARPRRVVLRCAREADGRVTLSVRDFGPGVPRRQLTRVFEPFYRGEAELTRRTQGSGIGLALVKDLAQAMGAAVRGVNAEGGGFRVSIAFEPQAPRPSV